VIIMKKARIIVLTGEGKGKSSSALGMVLRGVGHGLRVCVIQFIKDHLTFPTR
jgi:cob(I)alamin adenosyltransferase